MPNCGVGQRYEPAFPYSGLLAVIYPQKEKRAIFGEYTADPLPSTTSTLPYAISHGYNPSSLWQDPFAIKLYHEAGVQPDSEPPSRKSQGNSVIQQRRLLPHACAPSRIANPP
jgi:hypothetical protein